MATLEITDTLNQALRIARRSGMREAAAFLERQGIKTYGTESVTNHLTGRTLEYLNRGDTYKPTVCKCRNTFFVASWGDWYETQDRIAARRGLYRCPACSATVVRARRRNPKCECGNLLFS